ncbi:MAG TPA: TonB-dependent receptor [Candidatus Baltobacteraceae bacterium]
MRGLRFGALLAAIVWAYASGPAFAGTTGTLRGVIVDSKSGSPLAGVSVTADAPSQVATTLTDAAGQFQFISLAPDTYVVHAAKSGYDPLAQAGVVIFADQPLTLSLAMTPTLKTIARVASRGSSDQVRPGTTSDLYSVNNTGIQKTIATSGAGSMNQVYGAINSVPGVNIPTNQQGWNQGVYVRGGDYQQVAYEFDGLPLTRQSDLNPIATLTALGSQQVEVYTGGTAASSNSSGLAGYINQIIKTGTSPGYADASLGVGTPSYYHSATVEASGATPDRLFSYYLGLAGTNQDYRYADQFNGASNPLYFYPLAIPTTNSAFNILDGNCAAIKHPTCSAPSYGAAFSPGNSYAQAFNQDRENVANVHIGIPHRHDPMRDDIQLLWVTGGINTWFYSSQEELGKNNVAAAYGAYPVAFLDSTYYVGPLMQKPSNSFLQFNPFPNSMQHSPGAPVPTNERDGSINNYAIEKFQYQKNFNERSYLRFQAYGEYSNWFITAPVSAELAFGAELADYEVYEHAVGGVLTYSNQLSPKHLLTAGATYSQQILQTYNATFSSTDPTANSLLPTGLGTILSNYVGRDGNCYNYTTGQRWSCFDAGSQGGCLLTGYNEFNLGCYPGLASTFNLTPGTAPKGSPGAKAGAHWIMTEDGRSSQVDDVKPLFSGYSLTDLWQPNDKLTFNIGARFDHFAYATSNLADASLWPARQFWFTQFNKEHCGVLGSAPVSTWNGSGFSPCPAGYLPMTDPGNGLYNVGAGLSVHNSFQPRFSFTWTLNPNTVVRGSAGEYARAEASSYYQYNTAQQNLASFIRQFYSYGYHTPDHELYPDTSNNYDVSLEQHLKGTKISYKVTPFYRSTRNQVQFQSIDALGGTLAGLNVGTQKSYGIELALQMGDFAQDGLSGSLAYTHTNNSISFHLINGISVIDSLNGPIEQYNSYTKGCAGVTASSANWAACGSGKYAGNAQPVFNGACGPGCSVKNPYYCPTTTSSCPWSFQPILDVNASYPPYDVIPSPFNAANGFDVPDVATLVVNYRHGKYDFTPSLHYLSGSQYGSPLVWPGYVPQACTRNPALYPATPGAFCGSGGALFLPDPYNGYRFDNLGTYAQPSQLSLNLSASYDVSDRLTIGFSAVNLYNKCFQRGYAWDNQQTCVYSTLPSNILGSAGNFLMAPPIQVKYPYGTFFNITEVGNSSMEQPFNLFVNATLKI